MTPDGRWVGRGYEGEKKLVFDSEKEWTRYLFLVGEQKAGRIQGLRHHKTYKLYGKNGAVVARYEADFVYICNGRLVVEDVKSEITRKLPTWKIKRALMLDNYGIDVVEI